MTLWWPCSATALARLAPTFTRATCRLHRAVLGSMTWGPFWLPSLPSTAASNCTESAAAQRSQVLMKELDTLKKANSTLQQQHRWWRLRQQQLSGGSSRGTLWWWL